MTNFKALRDAVERRLRSAGERVDAAQREVERTQRELAEAERELCELKADAGRRLDAIQLVEEMSREVGGETLCQPYRELTQDEAMREALRKVNQPLNSTELAEALIRGGYPFTSSNPANSVVVAANANRRGYFAKISKDGNRPLIGLAEWVPLREGEDPLADFLNDRPDGSDIGAGALR